MEPTSTNPYEYRETAEPLPLPAGPFKFEAGDFLYEVTEVKRPSIAWRMVSSFFYCCFVFSIILLFLSIPVVYFLFVYLIVELAIKIFQSQLNVVEIIGFVLFFLGIPVWFALIIGIAHVLDILQPRIMWRVLRRFFGYTMAIPEDAVPGHFFCVPRQQHKMSLADDYGWIRIEPTGIRFEGKHTKLFLPVNMISELTYNWSVGGSAMAIQFAGVPPFSSCIFVSYAGGLSLSGIKKAAKEFHAKIEDIAKPYLT